LVFAEEAVQTNSGVKYIQLDLGFFDNKKIKAIRSMPSGSDILVIWIELLVLAGQINDCGSIYFNHEVPFTDQLLSSQFCFPVSTIQLALATFQKFKMIDIVDDIIHISNWERYQNEEALERIRLLHNARQRAYYQRKKALRITDGDVSDDVNADVSSDEKCSYISNISSSLSKEDKGDEDKEREGKGKREKEEDKIGAMFCSFYEAYGNKKGRKAAEKSFRRISPDDGLFQRIMDGVKKYHNSRKWKEGYRKEPATWLNGECWNDEYDEESEVRRSGDNRGYRAGDHGAPRTVYDLKPQFAGHEHDGNDITDS
jgi:predicted phage replisome organizer